MYVGARSSAEIMNLYLPSSKENYRNLCLIGCKLQMGIVLISYKKFLYFLKW